MLDLGWTELTVIAVAAIIILGPKELPNALRTLGQWVRKARRLAGDFQKHLDDIVRESELDDVRREVNRISSTDIGREIDKAVDPDGEVSRKLKDDSPDSIASAPAGVDKAATPEVSKPVEEKAASDTPAKKAETVAQADKEQASSTGGKSADGA